MPEIKEMFECPYCGNNCLEEVMSEVFLYNPITHLEKNGDTVYGPRNKEGQIVQFQCVTCGWTIDVQSTLALYKYLTSPDCPCKPE